MESLCVSKHKSWLVILMMIGSLLIWQTQGVCIEEERKALLEIKGSLIDSYGVDLLPAWGDDGSTGGRSGGKCCDWERVTCNTITGHVTNLSLSNMLGMDEDKYGRKMSCTRMWPLNVSLFLHFKELTNLNLSWNCLDNNIVSTGLERLSSLKNLEILDLSLNSIENDIFPSLGALTSLRVLNLRDNILEGYLPALELAHLTTMEKLDLSVNMLNGTPSIQDCRRLSRLKKLESVTLHYNKFNNGIISCLSTIPFLKTLDLSQNRFRGSFPIQELAHMTNLEELDLSWNFGFNDTPSNQDCRILSRLKKLESVNLDHNKFNNSIISCLSTIPFLKTLDLSYNLLRGSFPIQELAHMTNLEKLDLSSNGFNDTPSIQDCRRLSKLKKLESVTLSYNDFNKTIISCLSALSSLKTLDLSENHLLGDSFPIRELAGLKELETLDLSDCEFESLTLNGMSPLPLPHLKLRTLDLSFNNFNGTLPMEALASFSHLEVLDLSWNKFFGSIPSTIQALSSLRVVSFALNNLNGSLPDQGLCELKNLHELDLSGNMFDGNLPQCFNRLSSLKLLDISSNQFRGTLLPSLIANLTSLEYVDFSNNRFEGSFSLSLFSNHTKLEVVRFVSNNNKFEVETEEPIGWIPMFQLKVLVLSRCNIKRPKGSVVPRFLLHQRMLHFIDLSHNSLVGNFPNRLIENNTMLEVLNLRNNSLTGIMCMPRYRNANTRWLDVSENHMNGTIPADIQKFLPSIEYLNLSSNSLDGVISSSIGDMRQIFVLDLSDNEFSGEVPKALFSNISSLGILKLSKNKLRGEVLSGNLSLGNIEKLGFDNNNFTGKIGNWTFQNHYMESLDISNNRFTGTIPRWISDMMSDNFELIVSNNGFEGPFPCGKTSFSFLDISYNSFSGPIPSCLDFQAMRHLHLGSNRFIGPIPNAFHNLTSVLTLDIGYNSLSGRIPEFLGNLSYLRILILRKNNFSGSIPKPLCQLSNVNLIDLSSNSLSGSIPSCLQKIMTSVYPAFDPIMQNSYSMPLSYAYQRVIYSINFDDFSPISFEAQDEVDFTTKAFSHPYKGSILDLLTGLDLSCNKLTGKIPKELGSLNRIYSLNLSHNQLTGTIPMQFSNLEKIESLDLSSNWLSGEVPPQLIKLTFLAFFNVSHNNLSGRLPEMKAQFGTFTKASYEGNPLLCGPPLDKKCMTTSYVTDQSTKDGSDKWYDIDMASFYGSSGSTWVVFLLGFVATIYINPYWRRRWLDVVEECMYTCYYFLEDSVCKVSMLFRKQDQLI